MQPGAIEAVVNTVLSTDHGLADRPGIQRKLEQLGKMKFSPAEFDAIYAGFAQKVLAAAKVKLDAAKTTYNLTDKALQGAFDAAADDMDGRAPRQFLDKAAASLRSMVKGPPKLGPNEALGLARALKASSDAKFIEQRANFSGTVPPGPQGSGKPPPAGSGKASAQP